VSRVVSEEFTAQAVSWSECGQPRTVHEEVCNIGRTSLRTCVQFGSFPAATVTQGETKPSAKRGTQARIVKWKVEQDK
jgi:hypothetical protein